MLAVCAAARAMDVGGSGVHVYMFAERSHEVGGKTEQIYESQHTGYIYTLLPPLFRL